MACFGPFWFWLRKYNIDPLSGPYEGRGEATNPVPSEYELLRGPIQFCSPGFPGIIANGVATRGQDAKIGKIGRLG